MSRSARELETPKTMNMQIVLGVGVMGAVIAAGAYVLWGPDALLKRRGKCVCSCQLLSTLWLPRQMCRSTEPWQHVLHECPVASISFGRVFGGVAASDSQGETDFSPAANFDQ